MTRTEAQRVKDREACRRWREKNPGKGAEATRRWRARNPAHASEQRLLTQYGETPGHVSVMFQAQGGRCAACDAPEHGGKNWHIDHCHQTGVVRGILCHHCNVALGMLKDSPARLVMLYRYLTVGV